MTDKKKWIKELIQKMGKRRKKYEPKMKPDAKSNPKVIKLLVTASLGTALVSFFATADGLKAYVFPNYWPALVISAAIQGTLFALSIKGGELLYNKPFRVKWLLRLLWAAMLMTSSIFSFVHIACIVYSDRLLTDDAHFILEDNCLLLNDEIETAINNHLTKKENQLRQYIDLLIPKNHTINFSEDERTSLSRKIETFEKVKKEKSDLYKSNQPGIDTIINYLNNFSEGNFTESNYQSFSTNISGIINAISQDIITLEEDVKTLNGEIKEIHGRLAQYHNVNDPAYINLLNKLEEKEKDRNKAVMKRDEWSSFKGILDSTKNDVDNLKSNSLANSINNKAISMLYLLESGQENDNKQISSTDFVNIASDIHTLLLSNMVLETDERMEQYTSFLANARTYDLLAEQKQIIEYEIDILYESDKYKDKNDIAKWTDYWDKRLSTVKDVIKVLPDDCFPLEKKQEKIQKTTDLRRLYLFELNDFELEFSLLFGQHRYKGMLIFSFIFAFGMDLFSLATGKLIARFKEPLL